MLARCASLRAGTSSVYHRIWHCHQCLAHKSDICASTRSQFFLQVDFIAESTTTEDDAATAGGGKVVTIRGRQKYDAMKRTIDLPSTTTIKLDAAGLITSHKDEWTASRFTMGFMKRPFGATTSFLYRTFGV